MRRFECNVCGSIFESEELAYKHLEDSEKIKENFEHYITVVEIGEDEDFFVEGEEELSIPQVEDEEPCPRSEISREEAEGTEVIEAKDLEEQLFALKVLENWDKLDETLEEGELKGELLSRFLGQERGHDKQFERNTGTRGAFVQYLKKTIEHLRHGFCDFCGTDFEKLASEFNIKIKLSEGFGSHGELSYDELVVMISHVKSKHPQVYEALKEIFESGLPPIKEEEKEPHVELPKHVKAREQLTKEEISEEICKDENLTKEFLRRAFEEWNRKRKE